MRIGVSVPVRELGKDIGAIREFAQCAEGLGYTHLRVPDMVFRERSREGTGIHEPMMLLSYLSAITERIELAPSVIILPARQTVLFAKQAAGLDMLSQGRLRIGVGVGSNECEYESLGQNYRVRGKRCSEQIELLRLLWRGGDVSFCGRFDTVPEGNFFPTPCNGSIPIWIGGASILGEGVIERIGRLADGWFVLCGKESFRGLHSRIVDVMERVGRGTSELGTEASVRIVGKPEGEWWSEVNSWRNLGISHLTIRTLNHGLAPEEHMQLLECAAEKFLGS